MLPALQQYDRTRIVTPVDSRCAAVLCTQSTYYDLPFPFCVVVTSEHTYSARYNHTHLAFNKYVCSQSRECGYQVGGMTGPATVLAVTPHVC